MIDVQFDTVLLSPAAANAVKVVSTEHVVAHGSRDLSVLGKSGMDVVGERVIAKVSNLPEGANQVSYQWQYSPTKTGTFSDIEYGGNKNSYEISEEDEDYYLRCKVTTSSRAISPTDGLNAPASEAAPSLLPRNSAPAHLYLSQVYRDRASIAR